MLIIGNQIRLTRFVLAAALRQRRDSFFQQMARQQVDAGAEWLLVDLGPQRRGTLDDVSWLVSTIHGEVSIPLVLRSDNLDALRAGVEASRERVLLDATLPGVGDVSPFIHLAKETGSAVALSACPDGLPTPTEARVSRITEELVPQALQAGLAINDIFVDPLVVALTCDQQMVPSTVETLRLLKVGADPVPNALIHLDDISDGVADAAKPYITQAYVTMLLAAGIDALVANASDPDLMEVIRVVLERDPSTAYERLLVRLFDLTKVEASLDLTAIDPTDPDQVNLFKTVRVLNNELLYADSYLQG